MILEYQDEDDLTDIMLFLDNLLSEPYSRWTYRYFVSEYPQYCFIIRNSQSLLIGCIIGRIDHTLHGEPTGYIGMVATHPDHRGKGYGKQLVEVLLQRFIDDGLCQVCLETEVSNTASIRLYKNLGFVKDMFLPKYYMNGNDAYKMRLVLKY
ncbi:hypothetical protein P9112_007690 [Eukaryota sp. TZLM1-RC]